MNWICKIFILLFLTGCAHTVIELDTSTEPSGIMACSEGTLLYGWRNASEMSATDKQCFARAKATCLRVYEGCLLKFIMRGPNNYWAICGVND